jgi:hypothetical protein
VYELIHILVHKRENCSDCADNIRYYGKNLVSWVTRYLGFLNPSGKDTPYIVYEFMGNGRSHATELKNNEFVTKASDYSHSHRRLCEGNILLNS